MTIDEAISHALEVAEQEEKNSKTGKWFEGEDWNIKAREQCAECAAEHRQRRERRDRWNADQHGEIAWID